MKNSFFVPCLVFILVSLAAGDGLAQPRPVTGPRPAAGGLRVAPGENVLIRSITGTRRQDMVRTPDYRTSATETSQTRYWGCVRVEYETAEDWTDELEFRYFVLVQHPDTKEYKLFTKNVNYIEIAKGRHASTVFLRPNSIQRHGQVQRAAVEIWEGGQRVAAASVPEEDKAQPWWQVAIMQGRIMVNPDILMNRAETPFAFVAHDNYQTIKP